jgi:hypothetical protein
MWVDDLLIDFPGYRNSSFSKFGDHRIHEYDFVREPTTTGTSAVVEPSAIRLAREPNNVLDCVQAINYFFYGDLQPMFDRHANKMGG